MYRYRFSVIIYTHQSSRRDVKCKDIFVSARSEHHARKLAIRDMQAEGYHVREIKLLGTSQVGK